MRSCCKGRRYIISKFEAIMLPCLFLYVHRVLNIRGAQAALEKKKNPLMIGLIGFHSTRTQKNL